MSKKQDPIDEAWAAIDAGGETLKLSELVGQTFSINRVDLVNTRNGQAYVGQVSSDTLGEERAWLTTSEGGRLFQKIAAVDEANGWPLTVLLTKEDGEMGAYHLDRIV